MTRLTHTAAAVVLIATTALAASAQRKDRGTKADFDGMLRESPAGLKLSNGDVEKMSPVKLLIDKRKDLKLTDDQQARLKAIGDALKEANAVHFKAIDSLRSEIRPRAGASADAERIRTQIARETVVGAVKVIRGNYAARLGDAMALLDDSQKPKAEELLGKQMVESEKTLTEKLGPSGGAAAGGRRGRPLGGAL